MKRINFLILIFIAPLSCFGYTSPPQDSLVSLSEITFHSEFEEQIFRDFFTHGKKDYLALFSMIDPTFDAGALSKSQNQYRAFINRIKDSNYIKKKPEKRIKFLYQAVHDRFFTKYELKNSFRDIFTGGRYNCVSATALYGILFNQLEIPYQIKELPTHVYLMAYPHTARVLVESTDPSGGFYAFNEPFKRSFVDQLAKNKLISQAEHRNNSINTLFDKYYFKDETINLDQLVGIQYTNQALYALEEENLREAYHQLEKAFLFRPSEKTAFLLKLLAINEVRSQIPICSIGTIESIR